MTYPVLAGRGGEGGRIRRRLGYVGPLEIAAGNESGKGHVTIGVMLAILLTCQLAILLTLTEGEADASGADLSGRRRNVPIS